MPVVILEIQWWCGTERMRIDLNALPVAKRIRTEEFWAGRAQPVVYRPRCTYRRDAGHRHVFALSYVPEDHPADLREAVVWGKSAVVIDQDLRSATAVWTTVPPLPDYDGKARVKVRMERGSSQRDRETVTRAKRCQQQFKAELLRRGSCCELSGEPLPEALEAAHIQDVEDGGPDVPENGLLLRADIHRLFDAGYIAVNADGSIRIASALSADYKALLRGKRVSSDALLRIADFLPKRRKRPVPRARGG